ncbi:MAG: thioredoxin [Alphaproteobacteria bacterium]|nr:thioredoxin [Alphaproteobacteria bacterium]
MTSPHITKVNKDNFEAEVLKADKVVLIDFYADWCGPCKAMAPTLEKFAEDKKDDIKVVKIDIDESPEIAAAFRVKSIPMLVTMKGGKGLMGMAGNVPRHIMDDFADKSLQLANQGHINDNKGPANKNSNKGGGPRP